ncbi:MAG: hypothetical protein J3R72DRAFT_78132 [Linnemannia gamsii]|nr:MAG: hypothetical protein J3R72DRAFT_78132 [Linnemannia gamsii]
MNTERLPPNSDVQAPRFSQNFWGKDDAGYSALTTRMRHAKVTCQEILGMFQARAVLEEDSLRDSLDVVRFEIEATGKSHIELASKMRDQLESALEEFNNSQKDKRKLHQASIDRTFRNKQLYLQQLVKAKEKYDAECVRTKGLSAARMNLVGKELDKVSVKMEKTELASRAADVEYQASIRQLTEINDKWIIEWRAACDKFQLLEEQRIDYVGTTLWNYANIISSTCVADDEVMYPARASVYAPPWNFATSIRISRALLMQVLRATTSQIYPRISTPKTPKEDRTTLSIAQQSHAYRRRRRNLERCQDLISLSLDPIPQTRHLAGNHTIPQKDDLILEESQLLRST